MEFSITTRMRILIYIAARSPSPAPGARSRDRSPRSSPASPRAIRPSPRTRASAASSCCGATAPTPTASRTRLGPSGGIAPPSTPGAIPRIARESQSPLRARKARRPRQARRPPCSLSRRCPRFTRASWSSSRRRACDLRNDGLGFVLRNQSLCSAALCCGSGVGWLAPVAIHEVPTYASLGESDGRSFAAPPQGSNAPLPLYVCVCVSHVQGWGWDRGVAAYQRSKHQQQHVTVS